MSGLLGFCSFLADKLSNFDTKNIKNRGLDRVGKYEDSFVGLYHSSLDMFDNKKTKEQPIFKDGCYLICDGSLYNSELESILDIYKEFGVDGFYKLDGSYSFVIYDTKLQKLFLHKDSVGKKPLYYYKDDFKIVFSSNIDAIKSNLSEKLHIDKEQVKYYIKHKYIGIDNLIYKEIKSVYAGEVIEIDISKKEVTKSFIEEKFDFDIDFNDFDSVKKRLFELVKESIHKRLDGVDTPVILFSGGVDSTILAYEALKYNPKTKLVALKQPLPFLNDEPYVRKFAKKMGVDIHYINIMNMDFINNIDSFIDKMDQPYGISAYYYQAQLSLKSKKYGDVLYVGNGADVIFYGMRKFEDWVDEAGTTKSFINIPMKYKHSKYGEYNQNNYLVAHGFIKVDKSSSENQVEARCPFEDKKIIAFVREIPKEFWMGKDIKFVLKEYLINEGFEKDYVYRKKIGFAFPFRYMMIFQYKHILEFLKDNQNLLKEYDIEVGELSYLSIFKRFDYFFQLYVLLKFLFKQHFVCYVRK